MMLSCGSFCAVVLLAVGVCGVTSPNTSFATIPVGYFGGAAVWPRPPASLDMLASMDVVVVEKWEGNCWDKCINASSAGRPCDPGCNGQDDMLTTLKAIKQRNPNVATGFYQNSFYLWTFQGQFPLNDSMKAENGSVITMEQDNGLMGQRLFALQEQNVVADWLNWQHALLATGFVDGVFLDKPQILPGYNATVDEYVICEKGTTPGRHTFAQACAPITKAVSDAYVSNKEAMLADQAKIWRPNGGFVMSYWFSGKAYGNMIFTGLVGHDPSQQITFLQQRLTTPGVDYLFLTGDKMSTDPSNTTSSCTHDKVANFLIVAEPGMFLGCGGGDPIFSYPLGKPLGPAVNSGSVWTRQFASGTNVTYDSSTHAGHIDWASTTPVPKF